MSKKSVLIKTADLKSVAHLYPQDLPISVQEDSKNTEIIFSDETKDLLGFLSENLLLPVSKRKKISEYLSNDLDLSTIEVSSVNALVNKVIFINELTRPCLEVLISNKWYPVMANVTLQYGFGGSVYARFTAYATIGSMQYSRIFYVSADDFEDKLGKKIKVKFSEILSNYRFRVCRQESIDKMVSLNKQAAHYAGLSGKVLDVIGNGLAFNAYLGWTDYALGTPTDAVIGIAEDKLDDANYRHNNELNYLNTSTVWRLPFVRVFSLRHKDYFYVDVEDLKEHQFSSEGRKNIVLPDNMLSVLDSVFNSDAKNTFGDLFAGRHGGIVILAHGPSGVGKTLSAEVYAETQSRPLYIMEMSEVGTDLRSVEASLQQIFARARKWNAVLLFDEADIFLSERVSSDLERSAIVGVFLRLLDYYEGTLFLTTNRVSAIDPAIKSRITLYLDYPELTPETRGVIWKNMLKAANFNLDEKVCTHLWDEICTTNLNGRQIRNQVRLLKLMHPNNDTIHYGNIYNSLKFVAK